METLTLDALQVFDKKFKRCVLLIRVELFIFVCIHSMISHNLKWNWDLPVIHVAVRR